MGIKYLKTYNMKPKRMWELLNFPERWYQWIVMYLFVSVSGVSIAYGLFFLMVKLFNISNPFGW